MPALHRALLLAPMLSFAYEPLSRRRIAGLAAASLAPRVARADEPAVDAEMLANIQKSRDAWKTNAARRGFAFEAGASMPFVKEDTVGAPDRSAPVHKFRSASPHARAPDHWLICAQVRTLDLRRSAAEEQTGDPQRSACRGRGVGPARRLGRGHGRLGPRGLLRQREDRRAAVRAAGLGPTLAVSRNSLVAVASMASREPPQLSDRVSRNISRRRDMLYGTQPRGRCAQVCEARPRSRLGGLIFDFSVLGPSRTSSGRLLTARGGVPRGLVSRAKSAGTERQKHRARAAT